MYASQGTSTRARLAELEALKARLSTLPLSPILTNTAPAITAPAQDQAAPRARSPRDNEPWNDFPNWIEPQTMSNTMLGANAGTAGVAPTTREQPFPIQPAPDDASAWLFQPDMLSTPNRFADPPLDDSTLNAVTPRPRQGSQSSWAGQQGFHHGSQQRGSSRSPLHLAAMEGNVACVRALLRHKAEVDGMNTRGRTPLHVCAEHGNSNGHVAVVRILIEHGAEVDARDDNGSTPLQVAAANGNDKVLDALATLGADVNAV